MAPQKIRTISQYHQALGLPDPHHPLISVINLDQLEPAEEPISLIFDFYSVSVKRALGAKYKYGQQPLDFDEGIMLFIKPGQVLGREGGNNMGKPSGWILSIHPDFLWNTTLAKTIKQYDFFDYSANEALHLSQEEETMIINIIQFIKQEYQSDLDKFTNNVIVAQLELLFSYSERFYNRQFLTRKKANHQILFNLEELLTDYFNSGKLPTNGMPSVQYIANTLNLTPNYLSSLLKVLTGKSTQQLIQDKLIDKAKEILSTTNLSVSEIAYQLGFNYPQSFSTLFKAKTNFSPLQFRKTFNS
ncbi:helix-turn-helix transcriptional regulator [Flavobacterium pectinovorum]|uniref:helix-turn-helix domain-containing protein n=1 Tax=Flavobacterium pectinovorum TaxID=29533 RepID=UPI00265F8B30|nr:helix-turn-helix transcriptional regulator [Flavobacterium pectinovorum]WKL49594.1 helix-turn-helix transcriptional regulator [Flavobacterium pectinovorum]